jgi:hypothetical protein
MRTPSGIRRVAIYLGEDDQLTRFHFLWFLCERWRASGIDVALLPHPAARVDADVAIMHVDATRRPAAYDAALRHYPRVINGEVRDISKRKISAELIRWRTAYDGPVVVKTDANCFDRPDFRQREKGEGTLGRLWSRVVNRVAPLGREIRWKATYPVYENPRQVPWSVWWDRRLVVERFLPEREDDLYVLRSWIFFGEREVVTRSVAAEPIVKIANTVRRDLIAEVPESIREARRRLGFDYGKFDFVIHRGTPVLLDANSTPGSSGNETPRLAAIADELAAGLFARSERSAKAL